MEWRYKYGCEISVVGGVGQGMSFWIDCLLLLTASSICSLLQAAGPSETPAARGQLALSPVPKAAPFSPDYLSQTFHTPPGIMLFFPLAEPQLLCVLWKAASHTQGS